MALRTRPITILLYRGVTFDFTPAMKDIVCTLLAELTTPPFPVLLEWDAVI